MATQNENEIDQRIRNNSYNAQVFNEAKNLLEQLILVTSSLNCLQGYTATIADAFEIWADLTNEEKLNQYSKQLNKRILQFNETCHYLANLLHHIYRGKKLKPEHITESHVYVFDICPKAVPDLMAFMSENIQLPPSMTSKTTLENTFKLLYGVVTLREQNWFL